MSSKKEKIDQLKNISLIEHSRPRCPTNFVVHLRAFLLAYCHQPKKPSLHLDQVPQLGGLRQFPSPQSHVKGVSFQQSL
jgi:hypothetical protein